MRKIIKFVIAFTIMFFLFQFLVTFFINKHDTSYTIIHENKKYSVRELCVRKKEMHYYNFQVFDENQKKFVFYYDENLRKQKRIMKDVEVYQEGNLYCLMPIFKDGKNGNILCRKNDEMVSYDYLKQKEVLLSPWVEQLKAKGYSLGDEVDSIEKQETVMVYNHFPENFSVSLWNYQGLYIMKKGSIKKLDVLEDDYYENNLGALVGQYYVFADTDAQFEYDRLHIIDIINEGRDFVDIHPSISKDSYFLGVVGEELYILDREHKKEYTFNIKTRKLNEVGNTDNNAKFYEKGKFSVENIYTISDNKKEFDKNDYNSEIEEKYHPIWKYYFMTSDYRVYYVLKDDLDGKVLLFQDSNLKDMRVIDDYIFYLSGDSIYAYQMSKGLHKIITYSELLYNNKNIFDVAKK